MKVEHLFEVLTVKSTMGGVGKKEIFRFGMYQFNINKIIKMMDAGKVEYEEETLNQTHIKHFAEKIMKLDKTKPLNKQRVSVTVDINAEYAKNLSSREGEWGLMVELPNNGGTMMIDGNHRLAYRYFNDINNMRVFVIPESEFEKVEG